MKISALLFAGMAAVLVEASRTDQGVEIKPTELEDVSVGAAQVQPSRDSENTAEEPKVEEEPKPNSAVDPVEASVRSWWGKKPVLRRRG